MVGIGQGRRRPQERHVPPAELSQRFNRLAGESRVVVVVKGMMRAHLRAAMRGERKAPLGQKAHARVVRLRAR